MCVRVCVGFEVLCRTVWVCVLVIFGITHTPCVLSETNLRMAESTHNAGLAMGRKGRIERERERVRNIKVLNSCFKQLLLPPLRA